MNNCKNCCKQMTCNRKECKQVKWSETKNYGIPRRGENENT